MLFVRIAFGSVLLLGVAFFAIQNAEQQVVMRFLGMESSQTHVLIVVLGSFLAGVAVATVGASLRTLKLRKTLRGEQRALLSVRRELQELRNAPIRELT